MTASEWAVDELAETLQSFLSGIVEVHGEAVGDYPLGLWWVALRRAEKISPVLLAHAYAHAEQVRRYREALEAETMKYEAALARLTGGPGPGPEGAN